MSSNSSKGSLCHDSEACVGIYIYRGHQLITFREELVAFYERRNVRMSQAKLVKLRREEGICGRRRIVRGFGCVFWCCAKLRLYGSR